MGAMCNYKQTPFWAMISLILVMIVLVVAIYCAQYKTDADFINKVASEGATATFHYDGGDYANGGTGTWKLDIEADNDIHEKRIRHKTYENGQEVKKILTTQQIADGINAYFETHKASLQNVQVSEEKSSGIWAHLMSKVSNTPLMNVMQYIMMGLSLFPSVITEIIGVSLDNKQLDKDYNLNAENETVPKADGKKYYDMTTEEVLAEKIKDDCAKKYLPKKESATAGMSMNMIIGGIAAIMLVVGFICYFINWGKGYGHHNAVFLNLLIQGLILTTTNFGGYLRNSHLYTKANCEEEADVKAGFDNADLPENILKKLKLRALRSNTSATGTEYENSSTLGSRQSTESSISTKSQESTKSEESSKSSEQESTKSKESSESKDSTSREESPVVKDGTHDSAASIRLPVDPERKIIDHGHGISKNTALLALADSYVHTGPEAQAAADKPKGKAREMEREERYRYHDAKALVDEPVADDETGEISSLNVDYMDEEEDEQKEDESGAQDSNNTAVSKKKVLPGGEPSVTVTDVVSVDRRRLKAYRPIDTLMMATM